MGKEYFVHPTAVVDEPVEIGEGTKIWHFTHIMSGAKNWGELHHRSKCLYRFRSTLGK